MTDLPVPEPARTEDLAPAVRLAFRHLGPAERDHRVAAFLYLVGRGDIDPAGLLVLRRQGALAGVLVTACIPGAGALIWPPVCLDQEPAACEDALLRHGLAALKRKGVKVFQALLAPEEEPLAASLV